MERKSTSTPEADEGDVRGREEPEPRLVRQLADGVNPESVRFAFGHPA